MKRFRLPVVFLVILLFAAMSIGTVNVQASELKIPNPTPEFYFNDFAKVMSSSTGSYIAKLGESTYKSTDGGQVVFVSIDTLNGSIIDEYANSLFNKWKIGSKDKGVLFIISMQEKKSRIEVGYGYEGVLTDLESNRLLLKFSLLNKEKGIDEAVKTIYSDIANTVSGNGDAVQDPDNTETKQQTNTANNIFKENPVATAIFIIAVLLLILMDFSLTGGQFTYFILSIIMASSGRGGRNSGGGGRSGGGGSSSGF